MNLRNGRWTHFYQITTHDSAAGALRTQAAALESRRVALVKQQDAIDAEIAGLKNDAFSAENVASSSQTISLNIVELLKTEVALREDLASLLPAVRDDARSGAAAASEAKRQAEQAAVDALEEAGWDINDQMMRASIGRNKNVKEARSRADVYSSRANDYDNSRENQDAIDAIKIQLNEIANRSLLGAGVRQ